MTAILTGRNILMNDGGIIMNVTKSVNDLVSFHRVLQSSYKNEDAAIWIRSKPNTRAIFNALLPLLGKKWKQKDKIAFLRNGYWISKGTEADIGLENGKSVRLLLVSNEK